MTPFPANWTVQTRVGPIDGGAFADNAIDRDGRIEAVLSCANGSAGLTRASGGVRILWHDAAGPSRYRGIRLFWV